LSSGNDPFGLHTGYVGRDGRLYRGIMDRLIEGDRRIRSFWSNRVSADTFRRCVAIDYGPVRANAARLKRVLDRGRVIRVTSPAGTDAELSIKGRKPSSRTATFPSQALAVTCPRAKSTYPGHPPAPKARWSSTAR